MWGLGTPSSWCIFRVSDPVSTAVAVAGPSGVAMAPVARLRMCRSCRKCMDEPASRRIERAGCWEQLDGRPLRLPLTMRSGSAAKVLADCKLSSTAESQSASVPWQRAMGEGTGRTTFKAQCHSLHKVQAAAGGTLSLFPISLMPRASWGIGLG